MRSRFGTIDIWGLASAFVPGWPCSEGRGRIGAWLRRGSGWSWTADPEALGRFWEQALGLQRLGAAGAYVLLASPSGALPKLLLQRAGEAKTAKNRMHLDIETPDVDAEAGRLEGIGARRLDRHARTEHGNRWVVMADPEGNEFCVCDGGSGGG